ncbi:MAG: hypothetical protein ACTSU5_06435, partial [Promethearchaeota archaeon]
VNFGVVREGGVVHLDPRFVESRRYRKYLAGVLWREALRSLFPACARDNEFNLQLLCELAARMPGGYRWTRKHIASWREFFTSGGRCAPYTAVVGGSLVAYSPSAGNVPRVPPSGLADWVGLFSNFEGTVTDADFWWAYLNFGFPRAPISPAPLEVELLDEVYRSLEYRPLGNLDTQELRDRLLRGLPPGERPAGRRAFGRALEALRDRRSCRSFKVDWGALGLEVVYVEAVAADGADFDELGDLLYPVPQLVLMQGAGPRPRACYYAILPPALVEGLSGYLQALERHGVLASHSILVFRDSGQWVDLAGCAGAPPNFGRKSRRGRAGEFLWWAGFEYGSGAGLEGGTWHPVDLALFDLARARGDAGFGLKPVANLLPKALERLRALLDYLGLAAGLVSDGGAAAEVLGTVGDFGLGGLLDLDPRGAYRAAGRVVSLVGALHPGAVTGKTRVSSPPGQDPAESPTVHEELALRTLPPGTRRALSRLGGPREGIDWATAARHLEGFRAAAFLASKFGAETRDAFGTSTERAGLARAAREFIRRAKVAASGVTAEWFEAHVGELLDRGVLACVNHANFLSPNTACRLVVEVHSPPEKLKQSLRRSLAAVIPYGGVVNTEDRATGESILYFHLRFPASTSFLFHIAWRVLSMAARGKRPARCEVHPVVASPHGQVAPAAEYLDLGTGEWSGDAGFLRDLAREAGERLARVKGFGSGSGGRAWGTGSGGAGAAAKRRRRRGRDSLAPELPPFLKVSGGRALEAAPRDPGFVHAAAPVLEHLFARPLATPGEVADLFPGVADPAGRFLRRVRGELGASPTVGVNVVRIGLREVYSSLELRGPGKWNLLARSLSPGFRGLSISSTLGSEATVHSLNVRPAHDPGDKLLAWHAGNADSRLGPWTEGTVAEHREFLNLSPYAAQGGYPAGRFAWFARWASRVPPGEAEGGNSVVHTSEPCPAVEVTPDLLERLDGLPSRLPWGGAADDSRFDWALERGLAHARLRVDPARLGLSQDFRLLVPGTTRAQEGLLLRVLSRLPHGEVYLLEDVRVRVPRGGEERHPRGFAAVVHLPPVDITPLLHSVLIDLLRHAGASGYQLSWWNLDVPAGTVARALLPGLLPRGAKVDPPPHRIHPLDPATARFRRVPKRDPDGWKLLPRELEEVKRAREKLDGYG